MSSERPTEQHEPVTDATRTDYSALSPENLAKYENLKRASLVNWDVPLTNGDTATISTTEVISEPVEPEVEGQEHWPVSDYSDVESSVLRSIKTAEMLASLRVSGEQIDPAATEATVTRINDLRVALAGIGQVGQHFNAVGTPVGDQVAVILTSHDVAALIMRLTGRVRLETI